MKGRCSMAETELWMVVTENGMYYTRRLVADGLTKDEAEKRKSAFRDGKNNPEHFHKVEYYIFPYTPSTKKKVLETERIQE
jgi:hypothetical protein